MIAHAPAMVYALAAALAPPSVQGLPGVQALPGSVVVIPFAPPVDQRLLYRVVQSWPTGDRMEHYTIVRELRFERAGDGYRLVALLRDLSSDAAEERALRLRAALAPLLGIAMHFDVSASGAITGLEDFDAVWAKVQSGQSAMLQSFGTDQDRRTMAQTVFDALGKMDRTQRLALLTGDIAPLFLFSGSRQTADDARDDDDIALAENPAPGVSVRYRISRRTGLVLWQEKQVDAFARSVHEIRTLEFPVP